MTLTTSTPRSSYRFDQHYADKLVAFNKALAQSRFWHVPPVGNAGDASTRVLFDAHESRVYPPLQKLSDFLVSHPFAYVESVTSQKRVATLHTRTRLLWNNELSNKAYSLADAQKLVLQGNWIGLRRWKLPSKEQLSTFAKAAKNPYRGGNAYRLMRVNDESVYNWMTDAGACDTDDGCWGVSTTGECFVFAVNSQWESCSDAELVVSLSELGMVLIAENGERFESKSLELSSEELLEVLLRDGGQLQAIGAAALCIDSAEFDFSNELEALDHQPCRLPLLDPAQLGDPHKGLWELWGEPAAVLTRFGLVARDPSRDVQRRAVAIDFGTSSTVVAMETEHGGRELLRIGVRDFYQLVEARHFENPTVLECMDCTAFAEVWTSQAYRPALDWRWMRAAHEAQASFRDNPGDTQILASILPRLKQWALRSTENDRLRLTDRTGHEFELPPHAERNPVRGQPLQVSAADAFDPIELYAWYLGMAINWRERGLFLKYYLSFPVKYPREVRERILASFRRGLQRSLPLTLIEHHPECLCEFEVSGLASEPAAYAAAALAKLAISPTEDGVPYAVFDFGGGTTDFDFGLLRWATSEEEARGYDQVFEHLASNGDNFLGGENLLEHLVYATFQHNLDELRRHRIKFTRPLDATTFAGYESFIAATQAAQTNSVMLAARLRFFLEGEGAELPAQLKLDLIDAGCDKKTCELLLDAQALDALLAARIRRGIQAFLAELARLRAQLPQQAIIHVLLAGNGSRSRHVRTMTEGDAWEELLDEVFGEAKPEIKVHPPLAVDEADPHSPTAKTGVALGLLRLIPGENVLLLDHVLCRHDGQAPFAWHAGRMRRGRFEPAITPEVDYGQWQDLGPMQDGVFNLFVSASPRAIQLAEGDPELKKYRLSFSATAAESRLFARAVAPSKLELGAAPNVSLVDSGEIKSLELA